MMVLANPLGLAALAALIVPLSIHLMRRSEDRLVSFAALRFLRDGPQPRRRWQLHEHALLGMRLILLAGLSVLLASPGGRDSPQHPAAWTLVVPGVGINEGDERLGEWHWLAPGFPALNANAGPDLQSPASLLREVDAALPLDTTITVIVPREIGGLDGQRLRLAHPVAWQVVPGASPHPTPLQEPVVPSGIAIRYSAAGASELPVARALAAAWSSAALHISEGPLDVPAESGRWLIWLGAPMTPQVMHWVQLGGRALTSSPARGETVLTDTEGAPVFRESRLGAGLVVSAVAPLITEKLPALLDPQIAQRLHTLLQTSVYPPDRAIAADVPPLTTTLSARPAAIRSWLPYCAFGAAVLFFVERLWATRKERVRPREARA